MDNLPQPEIVQLLGKLAAGQVHPLRSARRAMILWALDHTNGNVSHAAHILGTSRGTIYRYVGSHDITA